MAIFNARNLALRPLPIQRGQDLQCYFGRFLDAAALGHPAFPITSGHPNVAGGISPNYERRGQGLMTAYLI